VKFSFIARHRGIWAVDWMCGALGVSRGGFYAWLTRPRSRRSRRDEELSAKVRASFIGSDRTYGARRVWRDLLAEGFCCGLHRIERLMRLQALKARPRRHGGSGGVAGSLASSDVSFFATSMRRADVAIYERPCSTHRAFHKSSLCEPGPLRELTTTARINLSFRHRTSAHRYAHFSDTFYVAFNFIARLDRTKRLLACPS
jgi:transposase InsO family protein